MSRGSSICCRRSTGIRLARDARAERQRPGSGSAPLRALLIGRRGAAARCWTKVLDQHLRRSVHRDVRRVGSAVHRRAGRRTRHRRICRGSRFSQRAFVANTIALPAAQRHGVGARAAGARTSPGWYASVGRVFRAAGHDAVPEPPAARQSGVRQRSAPCTRGSRCARYPRSIASPAPPTCGASSRDAANTTSRTSASSSAGIGSFPVTDAPAAASSMLRRYLFDALGKEPAALQQPRTSKTRSRISPSPINVPLPITRRAAATASKTAFYGRG